MSQLGEDARKIGAGAPNRFSYDMPGREIFIEKYDI